VLGLLVVLTMAYLSKFISGFLAGLLSGLTYRQASVVGILMNTRGLMELVVLNIGLEAGILNRSVFTVMVLMSLISTFVTSPLVDYVYPEDIRGDSIVLEDSHGTTDEETPLGGFDRHTHRVGILCSDQNQLNPYLHFFTILCPRVPPSQLLLTIFVLPSNHSFPQVTPSSSASSHSKSLPMACAEVMSSPSLSPPSVELREPMESEIYFPIFEGFFTSLGAQVQLKYLHTSLSRHPYQPPVDSSESSILFNEPQELLLLPLLSLRDYDAISQLIATAPSPLGLLTPILHRPTLIPRQWVLTPHPPPHPIRRVLVLITGSTSDLFILNLIQRLCSNNLYLLFKIIITLPHHGHGDGDEEMVNQDRHQQSSSFPPLSIQDQSHESRGKSEGQERVNDEEAHDPHPPPSSSPYFGQREHCQLVRHKIMILKSLIHDGLLSNLQLKDLSGKVLPKKPLDTSTSNAKILREVKKSPSYQLVICGYLPKLAHSSNPSAPPWNLEMDPSRVLDLCGDTNLLMSLNLRDCLYLIISSSPMTPLPPLETSMHAFTCGD
jgi:hypothetical protein